MGVCGTYIIVYSGGVLEWDGVMVVYLICDGNHSSD